MPMLYPNLREMPVYTGLGFEWLCREYSKEGVTETEAFHEKYAKEQKQEVDLLTEIHMTPTRY